MAVAPGRPLTVDFKALTYISSLVEVFQPNSDGLVTAPELWGLLASLGLDKSKAEASDMLACADAARDGKLSVEELLDVMNAGELGLGAPGEMTVGAAHHEAAGAALVSADKLARVLGTLGDASLEDCVATAECLDGDGDSAITIEEFRFMANLL